MSIIWLSSYPGSGASRFRIFMANILRISDQEKLSRFLPAAADCKLFRQAVGYDAEDLTDQEIAWIRPQVYEYHADGSSEDLLYNIHDRYEIINGQPNIPLEESQAILYMARNPLDLTVHLMRTQNCSVSQAISILGNEEHIIFDGEDGYTRHLRQELDSWSGHVKSWLNLGHLHLEILRYEDLMTDPITCFAESADLMGLRLRATTLIAVLGQDGAAYRAMTHGVNAWTKVLGDKDIESIIKDHGPMMKVLGYLDDRGEPVRSFS